MGDFIWLLTSMKTCFQQGWCKLLNWKSNWRYGKSSKRLHVRVLLLKRISKSIEETVTSKNNLKNLLVEPFSEARWSKISSTYLSLKHADFPILDVEVVAELVHVGGDAVLLLGRLRDQELAGRRRKEKDFKTDQECFLCLLLDKLVLLLKLLSQLIHLIKENETQYSWKLTTSPYISDTLKHPWRSFSLKLPWKPVRWYFMKKRPIQKPIIPALPFSISLKNCKDQNPSQCRAGSNLMMAVTTGKWKGRGTEGQDRVLHKRHFMTK